MSRTSNPRAPLFAGAALIGLMAGGSLGHPAIAEVPPYAEEWATPGVPEDVEVDPAGRIWVACGDDSIRVYTPTGGQLLFAFGGTGTGDGEFQTPYGIAFDSIGNAYICDYAGARLEKFTSEGDYITGWPIPSNRADHVAVDSDDDVYVTGYDDFSVHKYTSSGVPLLDWTSFNGGRTAGILVAGGTVSVVLWDLPLVEQFTTESIFLGSFDAQTLNGDDIEIDAFNQLWVADYNGNRIRVFTTSGDSVDVLGEFGSGPGQFNGAIGVAVGTDGSIYVADEGNARIQRFGDPVPTAVPTAPGARVASVVLRSVAPNPSRATVAIDYEVARSEPVRLTVTDASGRTIATLQDGLVTAGEHRLSWTPQGSDHRQLEAGVYWARLAGASGESVRRLVVAR